MRKTISIIPENRVPDIVVALERKGFWPLHAVPSHPNQEVHMISRDCRREVHIQPCGQGQVRLEYYQLFVAPLVSFDYPPPCRAVVDS